MRSMLDSVTGHMMVKNEERYIKRVVKNIAPHLQRLIIYDTGSTDKTLDILDELHNTYLNIEIYEESIKEDAINWNGNHLSQHLTDIRNKMLKLSDSPWCMQIDGDEVYTLSTIKKISHTLDKLDKELSYGWVKGIMVKIKWCISDTQFVDPGPFIKTLRLFKHGGVWVGEFPNEFLYFDGAPITMMDNRCLTINDTFLHMSMAIHKERRPVAGKILPLTEEEIKLIQDA